MGAGNLIEIARVRDAIGCRDLLERARQYDRTNEKAHLKESAENGTPPRTSMLLQTVASLIHDFGRMKVSAEEGFEILEQIRSAAIEGFEKIRISPTALRGVPITNSDWEPLRRVMLAYKAMRNHYKRIYMGLLEDEGLQTRTVIPGTANSLRTVMPLARALDCQSRMIAFGLMHQVVLDFSEWDELCVMARHLRVSTFLDESLPDSCALIRPNTARALYVYPVLLWLAKPYGHNQTELQIIEKLARKWAAKVGFRIDSGHSRKENLQGPSVVLTSDHVLRLDTHKLVRSLVERRSEIADPMATKQSGLPAGVTLPQLIDLLNRLETAWGQAQWLDATELALGPVLEVPMRLGLPVGNVSSTANSAANGAANSAARGAAPQSWFVRSQSETVKYYGNTATIKRKASLPISSIGSLVALSTKKARPSELVVGVVTECAQITDVDFAPPHESQMVVRTLNGIGRAIDMMLPDSTRFEPGYCLYSNELDEAPSSVLVPAGRCKLPCEIQVREADETYKARLDLRVERIAGFERLSLTKI
jgi:hypothetical protein